jgi:crotonobetainyl-CoA:carnitine CoA-transferase CaiB-like acyl-CoA transferase
MNEPSPRPLDGIRVIEMGSVIAAPFCATLLSDLGAEIIKIERPDGGDPFRSMSPQVQGVPLWWGVVSRNKTCVTMDLKSPRDRRRFETLITSADIFIENNRPGVMDRLGLGWSALSKLNTRLMMLSISGYGQTGPYAARPGFGKIAEAMSGQVALTGQPEETPLHVGLGLAISMFVRDTTPDGAGAYTDVALYESLLRMLECQFALADLAGAPGVRTGRNHPYGWGATDEKSQQMTCHRCADGAWIIILESGDGQTEVPVGNLIDGCDASAALTKLKAAGIEAARIHDGASIAKDAYFVRRADVLTEDHALLGELKVPGFMPHGYDTAGLRRFYPPPPGK